MKKKQVITVSEEELVPLVSLRMAHVTATGADGRRYDWPCAGSVVKVLKADAEKFLQPSGEACCGGIRTPRFELAK